MGPDPLSGGMERGRISSVARHAEDLACLFVRLTDTHVPESISASRVGVLDHDPGLGLEVHPTCREAIGVVARLLEALGHRVEGSRPEALGHLRGAALDRIHQHFVTNACSIATIITHVVGPRGETFDVLPALTSGHAYDRRPARRRRPLRHDRRHQGR